MPLVPVPGWRHGRVEETVVQQHRKKRWVEQDNIILESSRNRVEDQPEEIKDRVNTFVAARLVAAVRCGRWGVSIGPNCSANVVHAQFSVFNYCIY